MALYPGDVYKDKEGKLWRLIAYTDLPTVTIEEIEHTDETFPGTWITRPKERRSVVVSSSLFKDYTRLVEEKK